MVFPSDWAGGWCGMLALVERLVVGGSDGGCVEVLGAGCS